MSRQTYQDQMQAAKSHALAAQYLAQAMSARKPETEERARAKHAEHKAMALAFDKSFVEPENATDEERIEAHKERSAFFEKRRQSRILAKYRGGYANARSASGSKSKICGDELSRTLEGLDANQVMSIAELVLGLAKNELVRKYEKLNEGQKRMNSGNRLRNAVKKGKISIEQIQSAMQVAA